MWGHYGSNHSGVAIGFHSSILINQVDGVFRSVRYRKKQPSIKLANKIYRSANENKDHIQKMMLLHLFRKACSWSYEKEARLVKFQADQFTSESRKIDIPINAIESVYFGSCMPEDDKRFLIDKIKNSPYKNIRFYEIYLTPYAYKLSSRPIVQ
jgi:hypothetical protein